MRRHRHLDRHPRAPRAPRRPGFESLEVRLVPSGSPTVGVYDENAVDPNTVDFVASGSSLTNTQFTAQVATAFNQDSGGVIDGEILGSLYSYGTSQAKTLTVQPAAGTNWGIGAGYHISKTGGFATSSPSYNSLTLNFTSIANGAANEHIVSVGVTALSITGRDYGNVTVTAHLVSGGSVSATRHINDATGAGDTFYGLTAPANDYITSVTLAYDGPVNGTPDTRLWFDDLGFITAPVTTNDRPPVAADDSYTVTAVTPTTVSAPGVLANDTDPDAGQTLSAVLVAQPAHGGVKLNPDGSFTYTPATGYSGPDGFTYKANDGQLDSNVATVHLTVSPPSCSIGGTVWADYNGDGVRGSLDGGLGGRTVYLDQNQNGQLDQGEASTTTASDGSYAFTGLTPGTYYVAEVLPGGWRQTTPAGERTVVLGGTTQTTFDFNELAGTADQDIAPYKKAGFTFDSTAGSSTKFFVAGTSDKSFYGGSPALSSQWVPVTVSLTRDDGVPFTVNSMDLSPTWTSIYVPIVTFVGTKLDGSAVSQSFNAGSTLGFKTFAFTGFTDVTSVAWFQHDPTDEVQWDNVKLQSTGALNVTGANFGTQHIADAAPVAANDTYSTAPNTALIVSAPGVLGNDSDPDGDPLTAKLVAGPTHGVLALNANGSFSYTPASGYNGFDSFTYKANDARLDSNVATVTLVVPTLKVTQFTPTASGFAVRFNRAIDTAVLSLYSSSTVPGSAGPPDVTLFGATTGPVAGSVVVDPDGQGLTFLATAGALPADTYTVTLRSNSDNGLRDTPGGSALDGAGSGTPGANYTTTFAAAGGRSIGVPPFLRGPGQTVAVPAATGIGLPVRLSDATGVQTASFTVDFDPARLTVTGASADPSMPAGTQVTANLTAPGTLTVTVLAPAPLPAGSATLVDLSASVPASAPYTTKEIVSVGPVALADGLGNPVPVTGYGSVHVVDFPGDSSGNGVINSFDSTLIQRYILGLDSGLGAFKDADPLLVGDVSGNGVVNSFDRTLIQQYILGQNPPQIPSVPNQTLTQGGPDPLVSLPRGLAVTPGGSVSVPVALAQVSSGAVGLDSFDLAIAYDPAAFRVEGVQAGVLAAGFDLLWSTSVAQGLLVISASRVAGPVSLAPGSSGSLAVIDLVARPGARPGASALRLLTVAYGANGPRATLLDDGRLTVTTADGSVTVRRGAASAPVGWVAVASRQAAALAPVGRPAVPAGPHAAAARGRAGLSAATAGSRPRALPAQGVPNGTRRSDRGG